MILPWSIVYSVGQPSKQNMKKILCGDFLSADFPAITLIVNEFAKKIFLKHLLFYVVES